MSDESGTLREGEHHPAADSAMTWIKSHPMLMLKWTEPLASTALSGNRVAELCYETLRRLQAGEPVSDRYLLGLAWTLREFEAGERHDRTDGGSNE